MVRSDGSDQRTDVEELLSKKDLALRDAGNVQEVVDQARHVRDLAIEHRASGPQVVLAGIGTIEDLVGVANRTERVAELVAEHRQELVFLPVRFTKQSLRGLLVGYVREGHDTADRPAILLERR